MATSYDEVYTIFLNKITDFDLPTMTDDELSDYCYDVFKSALTKLYASNIRYENIDDEEMEFIEDLTSVEVEILANQMTVEWIDRKLKTAQLLNMYVGTKDDNMNSQANHIKQLISLKNDTRADISSLMNFNEWSKWDGMM